MGVEPHFLEPHFLVPVWYPSSALPRASTSSELVHSNWLRRKISPAKTSHQLAPKFSQVPVTDRQRTLPRLSLYLPWFVTSLRMCCANRYHWKRRRGLEGQVTVPFRRTEGRNHVDSKFTAIPFHYLSFLFLEMGKKTKQKSQGGVRQAGLLTSFSGRSTKGGHSTSCSRSRKKGHDRW